MKSAIIGFSYYFIDAGNIRHALFYLKPFEYLPTNCFLHKGQYYVPVAHLVSIEAVTGGEYA